MQPQATIGQSPLLLAQPHGGNWIPDKLLNRLNSLGREKSDADWHIAKLYEGLVDEATIVSTPVHRYVIDMNRNPSDESLYPGQNTTALCPTSTFDGQAIYLPGQEPDSEEIETRLRLYHQPYHQLLLQQLERIRQKHGYVILYDCHSIRSEVPFLFEGKLPDFNIGSNNTTTCDAAIQQLVEAVCDSQQHYSRVSNGRFKGGWTTRHYGNPQAGYHAIQMELAQCNYMQESPPWTYLPEKADQLRDVLKSILRAISEFR
ncbi:MAG: N-formylglutamate deformylase [Gammaproteobacteria bacterium]|nr:N-formylglutamate deformylase [Gammaproteobacteria bacterium]